MMMFYYMFFPPRLAYHYSVAYLMYLLMMYNLIVTQVQNGFKMGEITL